MAKWVLPVLCWLMLGISAFPQAATPAEGSAAEFSNANRAFSAGNLDSALSFVNKGLAEDPRSVTGLNLLGLIYDQRGQHQQALIQFRRALAIEPKSVETWINIATSLAAAKENAGAEEALRQALRLQPGNRTASYDLGLLLLNENKPKQALPVLLRMPSPDESTRLLIVQARFDTQTTTEAKRAARKLSQEFPKDTRVHVSLGELLASHRQYRQAAYEFELADALDPGNFDILHDLGRAYMLSGQLSHAQASLSKASALHPDSANTLYLLAQVANGEHREVDALELLARAHKIAPKNTDVIFLMAELSMKESYFEDAIEVLKEGLKVDPKRADLHAALGESYFSVGQTEKAKEEFRTLLALDPSPRSYVFMGLCYLHLGKYDEAKHYFKQSLSADPNYLPALYNLGVIARGQDDPALSVRYLQRAVRLDGDYPEAVFELGNLMLDQRKFADAAPLFRHFVEVSPTSAPGYYKLAMAERGLHETADADRDLKIFMTLSKSPQPLPYPLRHVFDFLERRSTMTAQQRNDLEIRQLELEVKQHPDRPRSFYLLAEALLKAGRTADAMQALRRLDAISGGDYRTEMNTGILLGRFHQNADAIRYFQAALKVSPSSDDAKYDLANAYFQAGSDEAALQQLEQISPDGQKEASCAGLLGDVYARMGRYDDASRSLRRAIVADPDNDEYYVSLALARIHAGDQEDGQEIVRRGLARIPDSGRLYWAKGVLEVVENRQGEAESSLRRATELNPSSEMFAATLGIFYYEEGEYSKARKVLQQCEEMFPNGAMNFQKIAAVLQASPNSGVQIPASMTPQARKQVFQLAAAMRDREQR